MECTEHCLFTAAIAEPKVCDEEWPENEALQVQYLWETESALVVSGYCAYECAEIGFPHRLLGTRGAELIRECRPPVPYLNGDEKETVTWSSLLYV